MMKKVLLTSLVAAVALFGSEGHYFTQEGSERAVVIESTTANEIVLSGTRVDFHAGDQQAVVSGQFLYAGDVKMVNIPLSYKLTPHFALEASVPLVSVMNYTDPVTLEEEDNYGIGDVSVGVNANYGAFQDTFGFHFVSLRYKTSSGDETKGLGLGEDAITLSYSNTKTIADFQTFVMLSYTLNENKVLGDSSYFVLGGSMPCLLSDQVRTSAKVTNFAIEENE